MKKIFIGVFALALAVGANAQQKGFGEGMRKRHHHEQFNFQQLNLTEDQKAQFKSLNEGFHQKMQSLDKQDNLTVKEWRSRKEALRKEHKEKMQSILTKDQKDQLAKMREERKAKRKEFGEKRMSMMKQHLDLTDEQSARIKTLNAGLHEKIKAIRENQSLAREEKRDQVMDLMKENHEKMKSILTAEQLQKLKDMRQKHGRRRAV